MAEKSKSQDRSLYYAFIIYPGDSAPDNWKEILESYHVAMAISPEHHPGVSDPEQGEPEGNELKLHRHVMIFYGSTKSKKQAEEISEAVHGTRPFPVHSKEGYARYLLHLDNPEKEQFKFEDVICLSGLVYQDNIGTPYNRDTVIREMIMYVDEHKIFALSDLIRYSMNNNDTWFRALTREAAYIMKEYMSSSFWKLRNKYVIEAYQDEEHTSQLTNGEAQPPVDEIL